MRRRFLRSYVSAIALWLSLCVVSQAPPARSQEKGSPLLTGYGPARMPIKAQAAAPKTEIEGEFVLRQKYLRNQHSRDVFHGWATNKNMWRGLVGGGGGSLRPALAAMSGTSNPEADFMALLEAGWLDREQIIKGFEVKKRHDRLSSYARAKAVEAQKNKDPVTVAKARVACADMDRAHYLEKKTLMADIRKVLAQRRPDLLCSAPSCGAPPGGGRTGAPAPPPRPMMPPPMGSPY